MVRLLICDIVFSLLIIISTSTSVFAKNCEDDSIREVSESGDILIMLSGHIYKVLSGDEVDSSLWLSAEDVLVCEAPFTYRGKVVDMTEIINTDENGEKISAERLR